MSERHEDIRVAVHLVATEDRDFSWMLGDSPSGSDPALTLPEGGVEDPEILKTLRATAAILRAGFGTGSWMIVSGSQVVGLCSYKAPPSPKGVVEISYAIAVGVRGRGFASAAVAELVSIARADERIRGLLVETHHHNLASIVVLKRNGFLQTGTQFSEEGQILIWGLALNRQVAV